MPTGGACKQRCVWQHTSSSHRVVQQCVQVSTPHYTMSMGGIAQAPAARRQRQRRSRSARATVQVYASTIPTLRLTPPPLAVPLPAAAQAQMASTLRVRRNSEQGATGTTATALSRAPIASAITTHALPLPLHTGTTSPTVTFSNIAVAKPHWLAAINTRSTAEPAYASSGTAAAVLNRVTHGIPIVPTPYPSNTARPNTGTVRSHPREASERIAAYMASGAVKIVERSELDVVHSLHMVLRDGKKPRLVLDCSRNLNELLTVQRMHIGATIDSAMAASTPQCWYAKLDISDCFLSFPLTAPARRLLGFCFAGKHYAFQRLMFGLSTAPSECERMLDLISWVLTHQHGVRHRRYCDDILIIGNTREECARMLADATAALARFGFAIATTKTVHPTQSIEFLGILFDSRTTTIACTPARISELITLLRQHLHAPLKRSVRHVLSLVGKLSFAATVLPGARPFFRHLIDVTKGCDKWVTLDSACLDDMRHWLAFLPTWNGRRLWTQPAAVVVATDASITGWGIHVRSAPASTRLPHTIAVNSGIAGSWCPSHAHLMSSSRDIGWGELYAAVFAAVVLAPHVTNGSIEFLVDNAADVHIINRQSTRSPRLLALLRLLYTTATRHNLHFAARHIPGVHNTVADALSRGTHPVSLLRVSRMCSCGLEVPAPNTSGSMLWSTPSLRWHSGQAHIAHIRACSSNITSSALPPVPMMPLRLTSGVSVLHASPSAAVVQSSPYPTSSPHCSGGTQTKASVLCHAVPSSSVCNAGSATCSANLTRSGQHTRFRSPTSTTSCPPSISPSMTMLAAGARFSSGSMVSYASASTPVTACSSVSGQLPSPTTASLSPFRGRRLTFLPSTCESPREAICSAQSQPRATSHRSSRHRARPTQRSSPTVSIPIAPSPTKTSSAG